MTAFNNVNILRFPRLNIRDMTIVTLGSYQIKNHNSYITDMTNHEVLEFLSGLPEEQVQINFNVYDLLMSGLPTSKKVFIFDQDEQPDNWPENYGPWMRQRIVTCRVPSAHSKSAEHHVVIAYIPPEFVENEEEIENPLGFNVPGYRRIVGYACFSDRCKIGMRNVGCCSHVAAVIIFLGVYAFDPDLFKDTHRPVHKLDIRHPASLNRELFGREYPDIEV